jgi:methyl-accepting chemotaxis protein
MIVPKMVIFRALKVAVIVGTILNLINQGDALFGSKDLELFKAALTYCVPFCVSLHGAVSALKA